MTGITKQREQLNERIKVSLADYISVNVDTDTNVYKTKKELALARYVLDEGIEAFVATLSALKQSFFLLQKLNEQLAQAVENPLNVSVIAPNLSTDLNILRQSITVLDQIEEKSYRVVNAIKSVASVAKTGAEVESLLSSKLDAAQVYSILTQLPTILSSILSATLATYFHNKAISNGKVLPTTSVVSELTAILLNEFNEALNSSVNTLTYNPTTPINDRHDGVIEKQVIEMLKTVPVNAYYDKPEDVPTPLLSQ